MELSNSDRTPADNLINEVFFDKKCGLDGSHDRLYQWCSEVPAERLVKSRCEGISGSAGPCELEAAFVPSENYNTSKLSEFVSNSTAVPGEPKFIYIKHACSMGGEDSTKWTNETKFLPLPRDELDKIILNCRQELYGVEGMPLWLILLVAFLVVIAVSVAGSLFWKFWLKHKISKRNVPDGGSRSSNFKHRRLL